jgi:flagellar hook-associated protein 3 FlgL
MLRVTTGMIYDQGVGSIQRQTAQLLHTQQQVSTGRRILTPADDPVASARALEVSQSKSVNDQFQINQGGAKDALGLYENKLAAVEDLIIAVRTRTVEAGNGAFSSAELQDIATDLRGQFDALMGLANSQDGTGEYLFAGYKGNTQPFAGSIAAGVSYQGDQGERSIQVSASRVVPISNSGDEVFMKIPGLNGQFSTGPAAANTGAATIDGGEVTSYDGTTPYRITFTAAGSGYTYTVEDVTVPATPVTVGSGPYVSGQAIAIGSGSNAISVTLTGTPAAGDVFDITPGGSTDMFSVFQDLIAALESGGTGNVFQNELAHALDGLDSSLDNVLRVRASVGSRMNEVEALENVGSDLAIQYTQTLSRLQDVDFAQAVSDLTLQKTYLEAAQQSFLRVSQLSLFNFLGS